MDGARVDPIAIIGMAGRFPGARDVDALWESLRAGKEAIRDLAPEELSRAGVPGEAARDPAWVARGSVLEDVELFDAGFFGLSPREALVTDPQQRLLLELAHEAFEDAGHPPGGSAGAAGVFVGASRSDYLERVLADPSHAAALGAFALEVATSRDFLATRIAYALDLSGPALTVQTACSTSLVAVHLACQSLLAGECELALAGGVSIRLPQASGYRWVEGGVASPDGRCRAFDARARGTVAGNGGALVLLRPLADALADGDPVHAVILATAVNNDGRAKVGFTAPSVEGQAAVVEEALAIAGVSAGDIGYVEAHGTGTPLGDPIEVAALAEAFRRRGGPPAGAGSCLLGSIKTNLGHLDAAAGIAGLVKAALVVGRGEVPPSLHFERPGPELGIESTPFRVAAQLARWPAREGPRRAGVSSFGIGGTNAHAVLEEPPARAAASPRGSPQLAVLSARGPQALERAIERLAARLEGEPGLDAAEVAWTLQAGRTAFAERAFAVGRTAGELASALRAGGGGGAGGGVARGRAEGRAPGVAFLFPGQGTQHAGMGLRASAGEPAVRRELDRAAEVLEPLLGVDLLRVLADGRGLAETRLAQPALLALEHALARHWMSLGLEPAAMLGHSIGEYVAACLAGVMSLEDALGLVAERGRLMQAMPPGSMLAVALSERALEERLSAESTPAELAIASVNGPEQVVASGPDGAIERLEAGLLAEGIPCRRLATSHAFHSALMDGAVEPFLEAVRRVELRPPRRRFLSNVTGTWITAGEATDPAYWAAHLRRTVRLFDGLERLSGDGTLLAIEVGPGRSFAAPARAAGLAVVPSLPHRASGQDEAVRLRTSLGQLWLRGVEVDWRALHDEAPRRVRLPTYPFERSRHFPGEPATATSPEAPPRDPAPMRQAAAVPRDREGSLLESVAAIWRECLGVLEIAPGDDFLDLGGSSLLAIAVRARIAEELAIELSMADVLEATRIEELVARVERARSGGARAPLAGPGSPLVRLGRRGAPLHCVHGLDGEVAAFAPLARALEPDHLLIALRAGGLEAGESPVDDVGELARRYAGAIRAAGPGPYHLAGHSFGALVALEMARLLHEQGEDVASLTLLDPRLPLTTSAGRGAALEEAAPDGTALDEGALRRDAAEHLAGLGLREDPASLERRLAVVTAHARAALRWRPRAFAGDALLLLARAESTPPAGEIAARWRSLVRGELAVGTAGGDHLSMLAPPEVGGLARALAERLVAARIPASGEP